MAEMEQNGKSYHLEQVTTDVQITNEENEEEEEARFMYLAKVPSFVLVLNYKAFVCITPCICITNQRAAICRNRICPSPFISYSFSVCRFKRLSCDVNPAGGRWEKSAVCLAWICGL